MKNIKISLWVVLFSVYSVGYSYEIELTRTFHKVMGTDNQLIVKVHEDRQVKVTFPEAYQHSGAYTFHMSSDLNSDLSYRLKNMD